MIRRLLSRFHAWLWRLPADPIESREEFLQRLEDEARRNQAIDESFRRVYRDPPQRGHGGVRPLTAYQRRQQRGGR